MYIKICPSVKQYNQKATVCILKLTPRFSSISTVPSYPAVGSPIYTVLLSAETLTIPLDPTSGRIVIVASLLIGDMSPLLVAETRDKVKCSDPSRMLSGWVRIVMVLRVSPCMC